MNKAISLKTLESLKLIDSTSKVTDNVIFDASALLAIIYEEKGSQIIKPLLNRSIMSAVNVAEVLTVLGRVDFNPSKALSFVSNIITNILPFDLQQAEQVAVLQPFVQIKGLSLGDRACIALGIKMNCPIYTADRIWSELKIEGANITQIR